MKSSDAKASKCCLKSSKMSIVHCTPMFIFNYLTLMAIRKQLIAIKVNLLNIQYTQEPEKMLILEETYRLLHLKPDLQNQKLPRK